MSQQPRLAGRVAVVTGAAQGIGRAIALRLARDGADVAINYRTHDERAAEAVAEVQALGRRAVAFRADVSDELEVRGMVDAIGAELGPPTILVNNAAVFPWSSWDELDVEVWDRTFAVNARGPWLMARAVVPGMVEAGWGRVVSLASATFLTGSSHLAHYAASKGAVLGLTRSLARALGHNGITVNAVSTGKTLTEGFQKYFDDGVLDYDETIASRDGQAIPRIGLPDDVTGAVAFLASEDAAYMTGQLLNVDGGRNMY
jgi:NAD(P)-dependent dehydrogenase (short-subunit alcohol dehydrogenase family)